MISVVIPSYNDAEGAFLTAASARVQLESLNVPFEIIVVGDGPNPPQPPFPAKLLLGHYGTPQAARHAGILASKGEYIFCLDSHVICSQGFFSDAITQLWALEVGLVFPSMALYKPEEKTYGYSIEWDKGWGLKQGFTAPKKDRPYPIAVASHGAFGIKRKAYLETGGYSLGQKGCGGEELFLNLKFWMLGWSCMMLPYHYHWHYIDKGRLQEKILRTRPSNLIFASYVLAGGKYFERVCAAYPNFGFSPETLLLAEKEREQIVVNLFGGDLDKLFTYWNALGVQF